MNMLGEVHNVYVDVEKNIHGDDKTVIVLETDYGTHVMDVTTSLLHDLQSVVDELRAKDF